MSLKIDVVQHRPYSIMEAEFLPNLFDYYAYPERYNIEPFRIFGNLYYVGDKRVCCHLIDTGKGLILFDTGFSHATHLLIRNIYKLGFNPKDVKIIIHSHGHFDHFGGGRRMKELYGCKICMGKLDVERLKINPRTALMEFSPEPYATIPETDVSLEDGDYISLGNTKIRCVSAPGHTEGTMAFFFNVNDGNTEKQVGYWGGVGFFTIYQDYLKKYGLPLDLRDHLGETITKLRKENPDITIGNHPSNNKTLERYNYMCEHPLENPFVDSSVWQEQLDVMEKGLQEFIEKNY